MTGLPASGDRVRSPPRGVRSRPVVGLDDARHQRMADDVGGGEAHLGDAGDALEQADRLDQAGDVCRAAGRSGSDRR